MEGGQIMVVAIIAIVMTAQVIKAAVTGKGDAWNMWGCGPYTKRSRRRRRDSETPITPDQTEVLAKMNQQLDRITERLAALETIVTDEDRELKRKFSDLEEDVEKARKNLSQSFQS